MEAGARETEEAEGSRKLEGEGHRRMALRRQGGGAHRSGSGGGVDLLRPDSAGQRLQHLRDRPAGQRPSGDKPTSFSVSKRIDV